jgi:hypothetical protein
MKGDSSVGKAPSKSTISATLVLAWLCLISATTSANPKLLGWLEGAYLQPWGVRVRAKLDSGALTSSIHAEQIEAFEHEGEPWVRFWFPFGAREGFEKGFLIEKPVLREAVIKEHEGENPTRYVVELDICVSGDTFATEVTLANRSKFNYPIILGRRALSGRFNVDSSSSFIGNRTCPRRDPITGQVQRQKN